MGRRTAIAGETGGEPPGNFGFAAISERRYLPAVHLARVIGRVVATIKQDTLATVPLQWIQPIRADGRSTGKPLVAVDRIGVGPGEAIYYVTSREASLTLDKPFAAVDAGIVGRVDWANVDGTRTLQDGR